MRARTNTTPRNNKIACTLEQLENRQLMSGTVTASMNLGDLNITGDAGNNHIRVKALPGDVWQVTGLYGTKINGLSQYISDPVTNDIQIDMGQGNDLVIVRGGTVQHILNIFGGDGDNTTILRDVTINYGLGVYGNAGNDICRAYNTTVVAVGQIYYSVFDLGAGKNTIVANNLSAWDFRVYTGADADRVTIRNSTLQSVAPLTISTGDGTDRITIVKVQIDTLAVDTGAGDKDTVRSIRSTATTAATFTDSGTNGILIGARNTYTNKTIDPNFTKRLGDLT